MEEWQNFVQNLIRVRVIQQAEEKAIQEWGNDIPITLLFARFGKAVVENFDKLSHEEQVYIFDTIEQGMKSSDNVLNTAVATGLLEAIGGQISKNPNLAQRVDAQLGVRSKKYLIDWNEHA